MCIGILFVVLSTKPVPETIIVMIIVAVIVLPVMFIVMMFGVFSACDDYCLLLCSLSDDCMPEMAFYCYDDC